jgi:hypothetical protein
VFVGTVIGFLGSGAHATNLTAGGSAQPITEATPTQWLVIKQTIPLAILAVGPNGVSVVTGVVNETVTQSNAGLLNFDFQIADVSGGSVTQWVWAVNYNSLSSGLTVICDNLPIGTICPGDGMISANGSTLTVTYPDNRLSSNRSSHPVNAGSSAIVYDSNGALIVFGVSSTGVPGVATLPAYEPGVLSVGPLCSPGGCSPFAPPRKQ